MDCTNELKLITASTAKNILENKDKLTVDSVNILGKVSVVSEIFSVKHDNLFCVILEDAVSVLIKKKVFLSWQEVLVPGKEFLFTDLRPTTLEKGAGHPIRLFVPTKTSQTYAHSMEKEHCIDFKEWLRQQGISESEMTVSSGDPDRGSNFHDDHITYQGVITSDDCSNIGVYELDSKIRLYASYLPVSYSSLVIGNTVIIHNVHIQKSLEEPRIRLVCCMSSCIKVMGTSISIKKKKVGIPKSLQMMFWKQQWGINSLIHVVDMIIQMGIKLKTVREKMFENMMSTVYTAVTKDVKFVLRNHLQEVLSPCGGCFLKEMNISTISLPTVSEVCIARANEILNDMAMGKHAKNQSWNQALYWNYIVEECSNQLIIGELHLGSNSGHIQLRDATGTIHCSVVEVHSDNDLIHICNDGCCLCNQCQRSKFTCPLLHPHHHGCLVAVTKYHIVHERFLTGDFTKLIRTEDIDSCKTSEKLKLYLVFDMTDVIFIHKDDSQDCSCGKLNSRSNFEGRTKNNDELIVYINHKESLVLSNNTKDMCGFSFVGHVCEHLHVVNRNESVVHNMPSHSCSSCQLVLFQGNHVQNYNTIQNRTLFRFNRLKFLKTDGEKLPWQLKQSAKKAGNFMCHVLSSEATYDRYFHNQHDQHPDILKSVDSIEDILSEKYTKDYVSVIGRIVRRVHQPPDEIGLILKKPRLNYTSEVDFVSTPGNWQIQLQLQCKLSGKEISVYLKLDNLVYPLALLPGAVVTMERLERKVSRRGVVYCNYSTVSCLQIVHQNWSSFQPSTRQPDEELPDQAQAQWSVLSWAYLGDAWLDSSVDQFYCIGSIQKVTKISLKCVCQTCGAVVIKHCTNNLCGSPVDRFIARMSVIIDDGTSVAMVTCTDTSVQLILRLSDDQWEALIQSVRDQGEVFLQQAFPENGSTLEKFVYLLCDHSELKQPLKWSLQCKHMTCAGKDVWKHPYELLQDMSIEDFPEKTVETGISRVRTKCLPLLQMKCLDVANVDYREQCLDLLKHV